MLKEDSADVKKVIFLTDGQATFRRHYVQELSNHAIVMDVVIFANFATATEFPPILPSLYSSPEEAAHATGGEYRIVNAPKQGTTVTPAVTPRALSAILPESVANNTATLFLFDTTTSMYLYSKQDWQRQRIARYRFKAAVNSGLAAASTAAKSATGARIGLATSWGRDGGRTLEALTYYLEHSIGSESPRLAYFSLIGGTNIDYALRRAHTTVSAETSANKRVVLISDGLSGVAQVQDSTLALYGNDSDSGVILDTVAWGAYDDEVEVKSWADAGDGIFNVATRP